MDASYSCRNWLTGFTRPKPPMQRQEVTLKVNISNWQNSKPTRSTFLRQGPQLSGFFQKPSSSLDQVFPSDIDFSLGASLIALRVFHFRLVACAPVILFVGLMVQRWWWWWWLLLKPKRGRNPSCRFANAFHKRCYYQHRDKLFFSKWIQHLWLLRWDGILTF